MQDYIYTWIPEVCGLNSSTVGMWEFFLKKQNQNKTWSEYIVYA